MLQRLVVQMVVVVIVVILESAVQGVAVTGVVVNQLTVAQSKNFTQKKRSLISTSIIKFVSISISIDPAILQTSYRLLKSIYKLTG